MSIGFGKSDRANLFYKLKRDLTASKLVVTSLLMSCFFIKW